MPAPARPRPAPPRPAEQWFQERPSPYPHEQDALDHVHALMPRAEPYRAWATFSFTARSGRVNECDLLIAVPGGLYLVEIKSHPGRLENSGSTWNFHGSDRTRTTSNPLHLTDLKCKELKSQFLWAARRCGVSERAVPRVEPAVFLSASDLDSRLDEVQRTRVYGRDDGGSGLARIWQDLLGRPPDRPERRITQEFSRHTLPLLLKTIGLRQSSAHLRFGDAWRLEPRPLEVGPSWEDRLARRDDGLVKEEGRVRIYLVNERATETARKSAQRAALREYQVLQGINHRGIAEAVEIREHQGGPAIMFRHRHRDLRLDQYLDTHGDRLPMETRLELVRQVAEAVRYAHNRALYHRALAARSVYVSCRPNGSRPKLRIIDWQTAAREFDTRATVLRSVGDSDLDLALVEDAAQVYLAPECDQDFPDSAELDVFGLGALAYLVLTGVPPAGQRSGLLERLRTEGGLRLFSVADGFSDALDDLVYQATRSDPEERLGSAEQFLALLEEAGAAAAAPEMFTAPAVDPLEAAPGQALDAEWTVVRVLGTGATARALLVERSTGVLDDSGDSLTEERVFKVALDEEKAERLRTEARVLEQAGGGNVVRLRGEGLRELGGRTVLELEYAGQQSLGARIREEGGLGPHLLERFGDDLFRAMDQLAARGLRHRDLKPDNLGIYRRKDRTYQLILFDFSLADASDRDIKAGTRGYLDPFLGSVLRAHYDDHAERYAAAVTLHEMAGGERPLWGDGKADPRTNETAELSIATELFDPALRDGLTAFFRRALHRDTEHRFDTLRQMQDAWRDVFRAADFADGTGHEETGEARDRAVAAAVAGTALAGAGLSWRAVSVAANLGAATVGELLAVPPHRISSARGAGAGVRKELNRRRKQWAARLGSPSGAAASPGGAVPPVQARVPDTGPAPITSADKAAGGQGAPGAGSAFADAPAVLSVDEMAARLAPPPGGRKSRRAAVVRLALGLAQDGDGPSPLGPWPLQARIVARLGGTQTTVSKYVREAAEEWAVAEAFGWLDQVRGELGDIVRAAGRVMTADEAAAELMARHGTMPDSPEPGRTRARALAVVRAAVEAETYELPLRETGRHRGSGAGAGRRDGPGGGGAGHEPRLAVHRRGDVVLLAAEPDTDEPAPRDLADYAVVLGAGADRLARQDPLPGRDTVLRGLRAVRAPEGLAPLTDTRLVTLAAAVSSSAAVTPRMELYPRDMDLGRALRICQAGAGVRTDRGITVADLVARLRARFPDLAAVSGAGPTHVGLEDPLARAGFSLEYDTVEGRFFLPAPEPSRTGSTTGAGTSLMPPPAPGRSPGSEPQDPHTSMRTRLDDSVRHGGFLALTVKLARLPGAAEAVAGAFPVRRIDVGRLFLGQFRTLAEEKGQDWAVVLRADAASAPGRIKPGLAAYSRAAWQRVEAALRAEAGPRTVLFAHNAGLLARFWTEGSHDLLVRLQAAARRPGTDPYGLWLLCPVLSRGEVPHLDGRTVEAVPGDGERAYLDGGFLADLTARSDGSAPAAGPGADAAPGSVTAP